MISLETLLFPYIKKIETHLEKIVNQFGKADNLALCIEYSVRNGGKRLRPVITLMVAEALGNNEVLDAAIALELFHTASLLADDLPCMDDANDRRGHVATHKIFGEATALLSSYALIAQGYQLINENSQVLPLSLSTQVLAMALQNASYNTGYWGASGGQFLDLYSKNINGKLLDEVMRKKTGALFETAFLFGWIFGGNVSNVQHVKQLGMNFGFAFQLVDDLFDYQEDMEKDRKINYAIYFGIELTIQRIEDLLSECKNSLQELHLATASLLGLVKLMESKVSHFKEVNL